MHKKILVIFSLYLLLPMFVYQLKDIHRIHVMKFTGSFSVVYENITPANIDITITEQTSLIPSSQFISVSYALGIFIFISQVLLSKIISNSNSPRAPPYI